MNNKLLEYRTNKNLKQSDIAEVIKKTVSHYGMLESGKRNPSIEVAWKLSNFYGVTIEDIFFKDRTT